MMRHLLLGLVAATMLGMPTAADEPDSGHLRRQQFAQQQAQALTRQLVSQVLDLQAAQLRQNGLTEVPVYTGILQMRQNLDQLVHQEMQGVVHHLMAAQQMQGQERIEAIQQARSEVRHVLLTLMAERQRLYRRMRLARLHMQVSELLLVQEKVAEQTRGLPQLPADSRAAAALANLSRQADAQGMFGQLEEALSDIRSWGGSLARSAVTAQQILEEGQSSRQVVQALSALREARYTDATRHQSALIAALYRILEDLQQAQGLADRSLETVVSQIDQLRSEQAALRDQTHQSDLTPDQADQLSQNQESVQQKLEDLARRLDQQPATRQPLRQAAEAASDAVARIFEGDQAAALAKQDETLAHLAALEEQLRQQAVPRSIASADQRKRQVEALEKAKDHLAEALNQQTAAARAFSEHPEQTQALAEAQEKASLQLDQAALIPDLPEVVKPMIAAAKSQAHRAATAAQAASQAPPQVLQQAADEATQATRQAMENLASTLADARRQQPATQIGELARAAEALDRAAAAQREISHETVQLASQPVESAGESLAELAGTQSDIAAVAKQIAEGTKHTAPQAAESLKQAQQAIDRARQAAQSLAESASSETAPAKAARQLQTASDQAEQHLSDAAEQLRVAAQEAARQLSATAGEQLAQIDSIEQALAAQLPSKPLDAEQREKLASLAGQVSPEAAARLRQPDDSMDAAASNPRRQAQAELAGRRQPIAQDRRTAEELVDLLANVSSASEQIQKLSDRLLAQSPDTAEGANEAASPSAESPPEENASATDSTNAPAAAPEARSPVAEALAQAMRQFAHNQRQATQWAAESAQQTEIANQPVREALRTASKLPTPQLPIPEDLTPLGQNKPASTASASQPSPSGTSQEGANAAGAGPKPPAVGQAAESSISGEPPAAEMGSSIVSPTPEITAQALAGQTALESLWAEMPQLLADGKGQGDQAGSVDSPTIAAPASAMLDNPTAGDASQADAQAQNTMSGSQASDQASNTVPGVSQQTADGGWSSSLPASGGGSTPATSARDFEQKAWFTKLPPGVQAAIRASVRRAPPPGYEERLRRYFENVD